MKDPVSYNGKLYKASYVSSLPKLKCIPDLLELGIYPNIKEITEAMGMYYAVIYCLKQMNKRSDPSIDLISIGDGNTPRVGALFAYRSAFTCYSIDPALKLNEKYDKINRLHIIKDRIQKVGNVFKNERLKIVVHCHSHVNLDEAAKYIDNVILTVAMPCCMEQLLLNGKFPDTSYEDHAVWSPKNLIRIWT